MIKDAIKASICVFCIGWSSLANAQTAYPSHTCATLERQVEQKENLYIRKIQKINTEMAVLTDKLNSLPGQSQTTQAKRAALASQQQELIQQKLQLRVEAQQKFAQINVGDKKDVQVMKQQRPLSSCTAYRDFTDFMS